MPRLDLGPIVLCAKSKSKNINQLPEDQLEIFSKAHGETMARYSVQIAGAALDVACDGGSSDLDLGEIQSYSVSFVPVRHSALVHIVSNYWAPLLTGYTRDFRETIVLAPALCDEKHRENIRANTAARYGDYWEN